MHNIYQHIDKQKGKFVKKLKDYCRQESISAENKGMKGMAELVASDLSGLGARVKYLKGRGGYPAIYGKFAGKGSKTILFYNHYDVQPPDPLSEWRFKPFSASLSGGKLYARGTSDNKGDLVARLSAVESFLKTCGSLPLNVTFFVEGEEEIGSPNLDGIVRENRQLLKSDYCIWESGGKNFEGRPKIYLGVKGILYVDLEINEASRDSHSSFATSIPNPAWKLTWALASMKDKSEKILIDGFYDDVVPLSDDEKKLVKNIPNEDGRIKKDLGIKDFLLGLRGKNRMMRDITQPTCTICGINSGYTGAGSKTVLPRKASAKVGFRLVPNQDPRDILRKLRRHLKKQNFKEIEIKVHGTTKPFKTALDSNLSEAAIDSARQIYGLEPVIYPTSLGTGPMYNLCGKLKIPAVSIGVDYAGSNMHAPNENIKISDFIQGIKHLVLLMEKLSNHAKKIDLF